MLGTVERCSWLISIIPILVLGDKLAFEIEGPYQKIPGKTGGVDVWGRITYDEQTDFHSAMAKIEEIGCINIHLRGNWSYDFTSYRIGGRWVVEFDAMLRNGVN